jgi:glycosyltransferase involved in cell wall biosynthesis
LVTAERLRVIHVASGREWRGGQRQVYLLARELARHDDVGSVVLTGRGTLLANRLEAAGARVHTVRWGAGLDPRVTLAVLGELGPHTIIHAHDNHAHALADLATRLRAAPLVVTRRLLLPIRSPRRYRRAAATIAISEAVRHEVLAAGVDPARTHVIPDAVDLTAAAAGHAWPESLPQPAVDSPLIVCIAALTVEKGLSVLLEAAAAMRAHLPSVRWLVLGEGPERAALEQLRRTLGLDLVVSFPGPVDAPEGVLPRASVMVQPSLSEGFGSSVLDALAAGVPVVASNVGGLPEALRGGGGRLVVPGDPHDLARTITRLFDHPDERAELSAAARAGVHRFAITRLVDATLDVYRSLMMTPVAP